MLQHITCKLFPNHHHNVCIFLVHEALISLFFNKHIPYKY